MEIIEVKIGKTGRDTYTGLEGTFANIVECCLRKKALPGFHEKGLIADVEVEGEDPDAGSRRQAHAGQADGNDGNRNAEYRGLSGKRGQCGFFYRGQIGKIKKGRYVWL